MPAALEPDGARRGGPAPAWAAVLGPRSTDGRIMPDFKRRSLRWDPFHPPTPPRADVKNPRTSPTHRGSYTLRDRPFVIARDCSKTTWLPADVMLQVDRSEISVQPIQDFPDEIGTSQEVGMTAVELAEHLVGFRRA